MQFKSSTPESFPHIGTTRCSGSLRKTEPLAVAQGAVSDTGIQYYPKLIEELVQDHHQLDLLTQRMKQHFNAGAFSQVTQMLNEYGVLLRNHLLKENMRLYIYLQQRVADDEVNTRLVRSFRKEMDGMAKTALNFLEKYKAIEQLPANQQAEFIIELEGIGAVVQERMHREENLLYPLYSPSYSS